MYSYEVDTNHTGGTVQPMAPLVYSMTPAKQAGLYSKGPSISNPTNLQYVNPPSDGETQPATLMYTSTYIVITY